MHTDIVTDIRNSWHVSFWKQKMQKNEWIRNYVTRVLQRWDGWSGSLKINDSHVARLEDRLDGFFEMTEKRVWIELIF